MFEYILSRCVEPVLWIKMGRTIDRVERYTYGLGSDISSVGIDPHNYVTRSLSGETFFMIDEIHKISRENQDMINMDDAT